MLLDFYGLPSQRSDSLQHCRIASPRSDAKCSAPIKFLAAAHDLQLTRIETIPPWLDIALYNLYKLPIRGAE